MDKHLQRLEQLELSFFAKDETVQAHEKLEKLVWQFLAKLNMHLLHEPAILPKRNII